MVLTGRIFNIQHFSLNDGAGIRTVVFFKGCPLDCEWCHNPESKSYEYELSFESSRCVLCGKCANICSQNAHIFEENSHCIERSKCISCGKCVELCDVQALEIIGKEYSIEDVMSEIAKDDIFFGENGGVTFSGGEPFMQFDFLYELLKCCKSKGYSTCIETSGFTKSDNIVRAAEYTDCFLFDCKETDAEKHKIYTGVENEKIIENLEMLSILNIPVVLRCPIIKGLNDREEHFKKIAFLANHYENILKIDIEPYHSFGERKKIALGKSECIFDTAEKNEKYMWLNTIREYTNKMVDFA